MKIDQFDLIPLVEYFNLLFLRSRPLKKMRRSKSNFLLCYQSKKEYLFVPAIQCNAGGDSTCSSMFNTKDALDSWNVRLSVG